MPLTLNDPRMQRIADKVAASERLTFEDGLLLDEQADLHTLGQLANQVDRKSTRLNSSH